MQPVILEGTRTPFGKWKGALRQIEAKQLGAHVLRELIRRVPETEQASGVLLAEVIQAGQGQNPARQVAQAAGISLSTPAITLNSVCPGGLAALADAVRRIQLGEGNLYVAGGFDSMTNAPYTVPVRKELALGPIEMTDTLINDGLWCSLSDQSMGILSDDINQQLSITREEQDAYAALSQQRAEQARDSGYLAEEITPIQAGKEVITDDEGIRNGTTAAKLAKLKPAFTTDGTITAGNASQMTDGASAGLITSEETAAQMGKQPLARILGWSEIAGPDTSLHDKPAKAIQKVLDSRNLSLGDIDLFEINEAFASVAIASSKQLGIDYEKVNINGGAIALGHPLGGTGFRLVLTLAHQLKRRGGGKGIAALCGGGGQGMAVLIEVPERW